MESTKRKRTTTRAQFEKMVEAMKREPDIAKNLTKKSPDLLQEFWMTLTEYLNSLGPPFKEISEWKKVWSDFKSAIRKKLANNKRSLNATGGGASEEQFFSPLEEDVIQLVNLRDAVHGVLETLDIGVAKKRKRQATATPTSDYSAPVCFRDIYEIIEIDNLDEFDVENENPDVPIVPSPKRRSITKTPSHIQLLQTQIDLQKAFYDEISTQLKEFNSILDKKNNILQLQLEETIRHNNVMERLVSEKRNVSNSSSE